MKMYFFNPAIASMILFIKPVAGKVHVCFHSKRSSYCGRVISGEEIQEVAESHLCTRCLHSMRIMHTGKFSYREEVPQRSPKKESNRTIVCLCGSTRFMQAFQEANLRETLAGQIVLTIGCDMRSDAMLGLGEEIKAELDALHKDKIDVADEILVLNVGGYIGRSTGSEILHAWKQGKRIRWLEEPMPLDELIKRLEA